MKQGTKIFYLRRKVIAAGAFALAAALMFWVRQSYSIYKNEISLLRAP